MSSRLLALSSALALVISATVFAHSATSTDAGIIATPALEQGISGANVAQAAKEQQHRKHKHTRKGKGKGKGNAGGKDKEPAPAPGAPPAQ